jgi:hypothetical protein
MFYDLKSTYILEAKSLQAAKQRTKLSSDWNPLAVKYKAKYL